MASSTLGVGVGAASTRESLLATLTALRSQNDRELRVAEEQLKLWETSPGFYAALVVRISRPSNHEVPKANYQDFKRFWAPKLQERRIASVIFIRPKRLETLIYPCYIFSQDIVLNSESIPMEVRWHAVLYFKNGIDKYWRKTAPK